MKYLSYALIVVTALAASLYAVVTEHYWFAALMFLASDWVFGKLSNLD